MQQLFVIVTPGMLGQVDFQTWRVNQGKKAETKAKERQ
jgi:hypothetical protein